MDYTEIVRVAYSYKRCFDLNFLAVCFGSRFGRKKLRRNVWYYTALGDYDMLQELAQSDIKT